MAKVRYRRGNVLLELSRTTALLTRLLERESSAPRPSHGALLTLVHIHGPVSGLVLPISLAVLANDRLLVVDHVSHGGRGSVLVYSGSRIVETLADRSVRAPTSACVARDGAVYVTSFELPQVGRLVGGALVPLGPEGPAARRPGRPAALAILPT